jgi:hypothetical protein
LEFGYKNLENEYFEKFQEFALETMLQPGKDEVAYAIENGHVGQDGVPEIMLVPDGAWCKRSYKTNYDAHSEVACIIGFHTKKILFWALKINTAWFAPDMVLKNFTFALKIGKVLPPVWKAISSSKDLN